MNDRKPSIEERYSAEEALTIGTISEVSICECGKSITGPHKKCEKCICNSNYIEYKSSNSLLSVTINIDGKKFSSFFYNLKDLITPECKDGAEFYTEEGILSVCKTKVKLNKLLEEFRNSAQLEFAATVIFAKIFKKNTSVQKIKDQFLDAAEKYLGYTIIIEKLNALEIKEKR